MTSANAVNSMHLFLLHPAVLVKKNASMFSPMHQACHGQQLHRNQVLFATTKAEDVVENNAFTLCVISRLMRCGCKFFVRNTVLHRSLRCKKPGLHCDLIGYQKKNNIFFLLSYAKKNSQLRRTFLHSKKFQQAMSTVVGEKTTLKSIVVPLQNFEENHQIVFRTKSK